MNTFNTTLVSPSWAIESEMSDEGRQFVHCGPQLSTDPSIEVRIERMDVLSEDNTYASEGGHSICMYISGNGKYNGSNINFDLDEESMGDPADLARRVAAQLLVAADALDNARQSGDPQQP